AGRCGFRGTRTGVRTGLRELSVDWGAPPAGAAELRRFQHRSGTSELADVSLTVRAGEIVGVAGAVGAGAVALGETVVGLRKPLSGTVCVAGRPVRPGSVPAALSAGSASCRRTVTARVWYRCGPSRRTSRSR